MFNHFEVSWYCFSDNNLSLMRQLQLEQFFPLDVQFRWKLVMKLWLWKGMNWILRKLLIYQISWCKVIIIQIFIKTTHTNKKSLQAHCISIHCVYFLGAYVPLTLESNIMVDGVLASCHASSDHDMAHFAMMPMIWLSEKLEWIFGKNNGIPLYVNLAFDLGNMMLPFSQIYLHL